MSFIDITSELLSQKFKMFETYKHKINICIVHGIDKWARRLYYRQYFYFYSQDHIFHTKDIQNAGLWFSLCDSPKTVGNN